MKPDRALTLRLDEAMYRALRLAAFEQETTISNLVRLAIERSGYSTDPLMVDDEDRVMDWLNASASLRVERIIQHGQQILDTRFADGVFE